MDEETDGEMCDDQRRLWPAGRMNNTGPWFLGCLPARQQCLWVSRGYEDKPFRRQFQGTVSALLHMSNHLDGGSLSISGWLAHYLRSHRKCSYHQGLYVEETQ